MTKQEMLQLLNQKRDSVIRLLSAKTITGAPAFNYVQILEALNIEISNSHRKAVSDFAIENGLRRYKTHTVKKAVPYVPSPTGEIPPIDLEVLNALNILKKYFSA